MQPGIPYLKGKSPNRWPPCTNFFRSAAIIFLELFTKQATLSRVSTGNVQSHNARWLYLPWSPWAERQRQDPFYYLSCRPRWPRQVQGTLNRYSFCPANFANVQRAFNEEVNCTEYSLQLVFPDTAILACSTVGPTPFSRQGKHLGATHFTLYHRCL
jgi:hypothetical protein